MPKKVKESPVMRCSESGDEVWVHSIDDDDENLDHIEDQIPLKVLFSTKHLKLGNSLNQQMPIRKPVSPKRKIKETDHECFPNKCEVLRLRVWMV